MLGIIALFVLTFIIWTIAASWSKLWELFRINRICTKELAKWPGPKSLPLIGTAYQFKLDNREFTYQIEEWAREYGLCDNSCGAFPIWVGPVPVAILLTHEVVRPLMESTENITKPVQYGKIMEWIGTGLLRDVICNFSKCEAQKKSDGLRFGSNFGGFFFEKKLDDP
ncbi:unnamed protein product [Caenorhabditis angaria]|uniref:Cytochrome P450 n=1 Tax=Caenorhabditis angaria TaxID=860376 RepID=A0A9P1ITX0_9PELO|nr:unnamed protein product [Caenorhabditis angaria]